jgi:hypothetical protein
VQTVKVLCSCLASAQTFVCTSWTETYTRTMNSSLQGKVATWFRIIYVLCLAAGAYSHASILVRHGGRWDYGGKPISTVLFWSALTVLDPLVAVLLFVRPRVGITSLMLLMLIDVIHNTWVIHVFGGIVWMVADQWLFLIFVFATAGTFWSAASEQHSSRTS